MIKVNTDFVKKLISVINAGLCRGLGHPDEGAMCVQAAVCYSARNLGYMDVAFGDKPNCVDADLRRIGIQLNDQNWGNNKKRADGLRRLAVAQLGTKGNFDMNEFSQRLKAFVSQEFVLPALKCVAKRAGEPLATALMAHAGENGIEDVTGLRDLLQNYFCGKSADKGPPGIGGLAIAVAALRSGTSDGVIGAIESAARCMSNKPECIDAERAYFAEGVVGILADMKTQGSEFLYLTEDEEA